MKKSTLFFSLLFLFIIGCKKAETSVTPIHAGLKQDFNYLPGSYWIYKDSITGRIDSMYIISASSGVDHNAHGDFETLDITLQQEPVVVANPADPSFWLIHLEDNYCDITARRNTSERHFSLRYPLTDPLNTDINFFIYSMVLGGKEYFHVYGFDMHIQGNETYLDFENGMVKMKLDWSPGDNKQYVWELMRNKLVQ